MGALVPLLVLLAATPARAVTHPKKAAAHAEVAPAKSDDVTAQLAAPGTVVADASDAVTPRKVIQADTTGTGAGGLAPEAAPEPPAVAPAAPPTPAADSAHVGRFAFGSYGRVAIGSDLLGQLGRSANVVAHGPRLIEDPYAELELRREDEWGAVTSRMVATMAFFSPFFHFSGDLAQNVGLRNLYFEAQVGDRFSAWAGSRMYRGDDVYLLNFWPLDNLNTIGGGASLKLTDDTTLKVHAGMQRLDNTPTPYQYQVVLSDNPLGGVGSVSVARLNRPRLIESVKLSHELHFGGVGARVSAYAEAHQLGAGVERDLSTGDETGLPADWGVLGGAQLSVWGDGTRFAHLWVRHARGLAAYDALEAPVTFNNALTTQGANSTRLALTGGWDTAHLGVLVGGYVDLMRDAGVSQVSAQKYDEGSVSVRGQWYATKYFGLAVEGSYQRRTYALVDEATGQRRSGGVTQLGVMPYFAPLGQGLFARPQVRLVYALSLRDAGARSFYAKDDVFSQRGVEHYVGVSVEWWFNSSTYPVR